ncbi:transmembrane protein 151 homolog [Paramacrobiotus metropolitanus]|uniref:transmembrane protein 151 homolog n=1 Tax=Paramacrobiotus metropolitanus TaxID=2943436 RepID=UPI002445F725|nr:transmembrane protein 151 homolog [Paramacrobiotus metropolitanus]
MDASAKPIPSVSYTVSQSNAPEQVQVQMPASPPLYEDVVDGRSPSSTNLVMKEPREWQEPGVACHEMFRKFITYWRLFVILCILTGIILLALWKSVLYAATWAVVTGSILLGAFYIAYILETFCCNSNTKFLNNSVMVSDIHQYVESVRGGAPAVVWHMECYHYETRTRLVSSGSGRSRTTRVETYTVKVTSWTGDQAFEFSNWADISDPRQLDTIGAFQQTRIKFDKQFVLSDNQTLASFEAQRDYFVAANRLRDTHYDLSESFEIAGFQPAVLASTTSEKPFFLTLHWYVLAVLFLLELPFSFMIKMQSARMQYVYVKKLGV